MEKALKFPMFLIRIKITIIIIIIIIINIFVIFHVVEQGSACTK
jgi:hypothetical protein